MKQSFQLGIYDLFGKSIFTTELKESRQAIDISNIPAGIYLYKIAVGNEVLKSGKLVIVK